MRQSNLSKFVKATGSAGKSDVPSDPKARPSLTAKPGKKEAEPEVLASKVDPVKSRANASGSKNMRQKKVSPVESKAKSAANGKNEVLEKSRGKIEPQKAEKVASKAPIVADPAEEESEEDEMIRRRSRRPRAKHIEESEEEEVKVPRQSKKRTLEQAGIEDDEAKATQASGKRRLICEEPRNLQPSRQLLAKRSSSRRAKPLELEERDEPTPPPRKQPSR